MFCKAQLLILTLFLILSALFKSALKCETQLSVYL